MPIDTTEIPETLPAPQWPAQRASDVAARLAKSDESLATWATQEAGVHATGTYANPWQLKQEIARRCELVMATMPKEWSKIVEDNDEILAIMRQNPCLPIVPPHLARVAAKEHAVAPLIRLWALGQILRAMDDMLAPELASGRFAHSEARLTGREAVADIVTRRGIFVLSVDTSDNLTIRDERGQPSLVRNLKGLADIPGLLETPEEHLERVVRAGELALHRNEWARAVDAWTDAATAENVDAIPELRTVAPQTRAMDSDTMDIGAVHAQMRAAWWDDIPERHPLRIADTAAFVKFVSLESLLAWGREHVLGPFVSAATAIGGAETSSPEFKKLLIDKWGLSDRISERKARWSWLSLLSWGNKRSDDHYEALARAIPALEVATSGLDVRAYDSLERLHTGHDSYGVRLVSGPINEYVRGTLDTSIAYLMSLYDDNESMGCIENGDVRVASLLHSRTVTMSDGTSVAAPPRLSKARSRNQENSPIWLATADNGKGAKRVGVTDFCLLMLAQAYPSDESPSEWWAQISARTEEISKARQDQGGPHLLERSGLRACASFVTSVQMSHPQR